MTMQKWKETDRSQSVDPLDGQLTAALEAVPHVAIADDFAARVMRQLPAPKPSQYRFATRASIGQRVSLIAAAVLLVAMLAFAAGSGGTNIANRTVAEAIFALEFAALTFWLSLRPSQSQ